MSSRAHEIVWQAIYVLSWMSQQTPGPAIKKHNEPVFKRPLDGLSMACERPLKGLYKIFKNI